MIIKFLLFLLSVAVLAAIPSFLWARQSPLETETSQSSTPAEMAPTETASIDRLTQPPVAQSFTNGPYTLVVEAVDSWRSPTAKATLTKAEATGDETLVWQKELPQQYGPRFSLVSSTGNVVLFDEYINVASPYAISLIDPTGNTIARYSFDDIQQTLATVSRADLTRQAASGWWISSGPTLDAAEQSALITTGGTTLEVDLATGELSRQD